MNTINVDLLSNTINEDDFYDYKHSQMPWSMSLYPCNENTVPRALLYRSDGMYVALAYVDESLVDVSVRHPCTEEDERNEHVYRAAKAMVSGVISLTRTPRNSLAALLCGLIDSRGGLALCLFDL